MVWHDHVGIETETDRVPPFEQDFLGRLGSGRITEDRLSVVGGCRDKTDAFRMRIIDRFQASAGSPRGQQNVRIIGMNLDPASGDFVHSLPGISEGFHGGISAAGRRIITHIHNHVNDNGWG